MASEDDAASNDSFEMPSSETQFIPQEGDEETLWKVIEIIDERKKDYLVKWEGIDPDKNKPWDPSWVPKHDCTDDLVASWKLFKKTRKPTKKTKKCVYLFKFINFFGGGNVLITLRGQTYIRQVESVHHLQCNLKNNYHLFGLDQPASDHGFCRTYARPRDGRNTPRIACQYLGKPQRQK